MLSVKYRSGTSSSAPSKVSKIAVTRSHASYDRRLEMLLLLPHVSAQMNRDTRKCGIVLVDLQRRTV